MVIGNDRSGGRSFCSRPTRRLSAALLFPAIPSPARNPYPLAPEGSLEWRHLALGLVGPLRTLVNPVARLFADIFHDFARILIFSAEGAAHLLASLGREQQSHQGAGCQSNQQHGQTQAKAS